MDRIEHASPFYWKHASAPHETFKGYVLLFVDDETELLEVFRGIFGKSNTVYTAQSGAMALAVLEKQTIDVILLDLHMPGTFDGVQTLSYIKQRDPLLSVVIYSAYLDMFTPEISQADEFIQKPIDAEKLAAVLKYYAELSRFKRYTDRT